MARKKISKNAAGKKPAGSSTKNRKSALKVASAGVNKTAPLTFESKKTAAAEDKKAYSKEEQEIIRRRRKAFEVIDGEAEVGKRKGAFGEDEIVDDPRSYDDDQYFYEETSEDRL